MGIKLKLDYVTINQQWIRVIEIVFFYQFIDSKKSTFSEFKQGQESQVAPQDAKYYHTIPVH